ncbi:MAG: glycosyl hydrolase [Gaiellaceae bacterium]
MGVSISNPEAPAELHGYIKAVGRKPAIVMWFQSFDEPLFYPKQLPVIAAIGAVPMITWVPSHSGGKSIPLLSIAAGNYDNYLRQAAAAAANWGKPLFVRFAHEMNLRDTPWGPGVDGNTAADYIAAWRHVVTIFRIAGATNVLWVWSPNVECGGACPFADFYPGDAWVDWVALDGYNYSAIDDVPWMSVSEIFGSSYSDLTKLTKRPIMIAETASTEVGGDKAAWITQGLLTDVPARLPRVRAVVWFQRDKETDWRVNSSAAALHAFRRVANSPLYTSNAADVVANASNTQSPLLPSVANHGSDRLVTCKVVTVKVKGHKVKRNKCKSKLVRGMVKFTTKSVVRATLSKGRVLYATGTATKKGLKLRTLRRVRAGRYTLTLRYHQGHRQIATRSQIKIG